MKEIEYTMDDAKEDAVMTYAERQKKLYELLSTTSNLDTSLDFRFEIGDKIYFTQGHQGLLTGYIASKAIKITGLFEDEALPVKTYGIVFLFQDEYLYKFEVEECFIYKSAEEGFEKLKIVANETR